MPSFPRLITILFPRFDHPAIEERYASWQSRLLLGRSAGEARVVYYDADEAASDVAGEVDTDLVAVVTDPLLLPAPNLIDRLAGALRDGLDAILPVSNEATHPQQRHPPMAPYLTLRELQETARGMQERENQGTELTWDGNDPGLYVCRTSLLERVHGPLAAALHGKNVWISRNDYVHRWSSLRGQVRDDLLARIPPTARNILEFGCGEAPLGAALKARQKCRVVGIELDAKAAAIARRRIDDVYCGDVRQIVSILDDRFDWIIGGDIIEHLDEPWSFLADLRRRLATPGGHLLLSLPNIANASVIADLLQGRFDYVYMGLTCVGHLRFFTRQSLEEMLTLAGWSVAEIIPQEFAATPSSEALLKSLDQVGLPYAKEDLLAAGYYVVARNG